ncbi:MAG: hypothetical protein JO033_01100 [Acidobacteriaceae bacterium]|nr:hypothetical protein [Candidatus Eremiobacteraeota bacterium]MBV8807244.1 hypothetical protein [Acidobacteriaceae bacterium]
MALQVGAWTANVSGTPTYITINDVDTEGNVNGFVGPNPLTGGFWDEDAQRIVLVCLQQVYVGYLFTDTINLIAPSGSVILTLSGYVQDYGSTTGGMGPNPTAKRSVFGWYAQIGVD